MTSDPIECRPTPWFLWRAILFLAMLLVFGGLFWKDWSYGYREKNLQFYTYEVFVKAGNLFTEFQNQNKSPQEWQTFASTQRTQVVNDVGLLPASYGTSIPWPQELQQYESMKSRGWNGAWLDYTKRQSWPDKRPEEAMSQSKINEQLIACIISLSLALIPAFFLIRTLRRRLILDNGILRCPDGKRYPVDALTQIDLRKWKTKGLAEVTGVINGETQKSRIDGLTYGGFSIDQGEPAETLMRALLENFKGEIVEYHDEDEEDSEDATEEEHSVSQ